MIEVGVIAAIMSMRLRNRTNQVAGWMLPPLLLGAWGLTNPFQLIVGHLYVLPPAYDMLTRHESVLVTSIMATVSIVGWLCFAVPYVELGSEDSPWRVRNSLALWEISNESVISEGEFYGYPVLHLDDGRKIVVAGAQRSNLMRLRGEENAIKSIRDHTINDNSKISLRYQVPALGGIWVVLWGITFVIGLSQGNFA